jgi:hypothetical protein
VGRVALFRGRGFDVGVGYPGGAKHADSRFEPLTWRCGGVISLLGCVCGVSCGVLSVIGTYYVPGSHTNGMADVEPSDFHLGARTTYRHNALLFDSNVLHFGPASARPVFKYSAVFVAGAKVKDRATMDSFYQQLMGREWDVSQDGYPIPLASALSGAMGHAV